MTRQRHTSAASNRDGSLEHIYQVLDANFNRAKEGLRVCEDIARFCLKDEKFTKRFRNLRHAVTEVIRSSRIDRLAMILKRQSAKDPGRSLTNKTHKRSYRHLFLANAQRVKEALRVLEEFSKLLDPQASRTIQKIRFRVYELEKTTVKKFPSLLDSR